MADVADTIIAPTGQAASPAVFIRDGHVFANSRDVATFFEKRHDDVLRKIDNLTEQLPALRARIFAETSSTVAVPNGGSRQNRSFDIDRDGFALLAMGFTGARALHWKLRWIEAFNRMEAELRALPPPKSVEVKGHTRALPKPHRRRSPVASPASPSVDREGFAVMRLAGEVLVVNLMDLDPAPGSRAVVIGWDKNILVEDMSEARSNRTCLGDRNFILPNPKDKKFPRSVYAVGMVVASQPATATRKAAKAKAKTRPVGAPNNRARPLGGSTLAHLQAIGTA